MLSLGWMGTMLGMRLYLPAMVRLRGVFYRVALVQSLNLDVDAAEMPADVVDIATGPVGRADLIEAALHAGKHVLAQKPLSMDEAELPRHQVRCDAGDL